ncbi:MAG TPA: hypothetical protein VF395_19405, partial [Polyangiaceae bacterium]
LLREPFPLTLLSEDLLELGHVVLGEVRSQATKKPLVVHVGTLVEHEDVGFVQRCPSKHQSVAHDVSGRHARHVVRICHGLSA